MALGDQVPIVLPGIPSSAYPAQGEMSKGRRKWREGELHFCHEHSLVKGGQMFIKCLLVPEALCKHLPALSRLLSLAAFRFLHCSLEETVAWRGYVTCLRSYYC